MSVRPYLEPEKTRSTTWRHHRCDRLRGVSPLQGTDPTFLDGPDRVDHPIQTRWSIEARRLSLKKINVGSKYKNTTHDKHVMRLLYRASQLNRLHGALDRPSSFQRNGFL